VGCPAAPAFRLVNARTRKGRVRRRGPTCVTGCNGRGRSRPRAASRPRWHPCGDEPGGVRTFLEPILSEAGLPAELADALDDTSFDAELPSETDEALALTGKDVGTPIIHFQPPDGVAFFGPVVSRLPSEAEAVPLWDNVLSLASFPGFAELKRRVRERPQLRSFGVEPGQVGVQEDWYAGRRRAPR